MLHEFLKARYDRYRLLDETEFGILIVHFDSCTFVFDHDSVVLFAEQDDFLLVVL